MAFKVTSLRAKLLLWLLIPSLSLWILGSCITYFLAINFANGAYDDSLEDTARAIASRLYLQKSGQLEIDLPPAAKELLEEDSLGHATRFKLYYQVLSPHGRLISGDSQFPAPVPSPKTIRFQDAEIHHQQVRLATLRLHMDEKNQIGPGFVVQVAETLKEREELAGDIFMAIVAPQFFMILMAGGIIWFGVKRGLLSLDKVRQAVAERTPQELHLLKEDAAPMEIRPLLQALNDLLVRVAADRDIQQRFIANAAHQLRTPIAGLKTQAELILRQTSPEDRNYHAITQIHTSAQRIKHLIKQLLVLARHEHRLSSTSSGEIGMVDLVALARKTTSDLVPQAIAKQIDLGFEQGVSHFELSGDIVSLREMMANLIENAIRYTPRNGKVTVSLNRDEAGLIRFSVEDNGPGIPESEKEQVFERFYRVSSDGPEGSGLGLSIVKEIANIHRAEVTLSPVVKGTGTIAAVRFLGERFRKEKVNVN